MDKRRLNTYFFWKLIFIIPTIIFTFFLSYFPLFFSFVLSLFKGRILDLTFYGFSNYINLFKDNIFFITIKNSILFTILTVPLIILFSLFIASKINALKAGKIEEIVTTIMFLPCTISPVTYSLFFKQISYSNGIISNILRDLNVVNSDYNILQSVWGSRFLIIFVCLWAWSGYYILLFISAIKNIDPIIFDAAKIDGASNLLIFRKITMPSITPVFHFLTIMAIIGTFQIYIESLLITKGGPGMATYTLTAYLYKRMFVYVVQFGYSSAIAGMIFLILMLVLILFLKISHEN
jgi:lactose/L-arabinose transport system permease protein